MAGHPQTRPRRPTGLRMSADEGMFDRGRGRAAVALCSFAVTYRAAPRQPLVTVLPILLYIGGGLVIVHASDRLGAVRGGVTGLVPVWVKRELEAIRRPPTRLVSMPPGHLFCGS